jgi:hypothetical protein
MDEIEQLLQSSFFKAVKRPIVPEKIQVHILAVINKIKAY